MSRTVFDAATRDELRRRMGTVSPDRRPLWGQMNAGQMLAHLNASLEMATGALPVQPKKTPLANPVMRWLVIYVMKWPHGTPTAPELQVVPDGDWNGSLTRYGELLDEVGALSPSGEWPRHPAFGMMSGKYWGALVAKHVDHHLRQFGA